MPFRPDNAAVAIPRSRFRPDAPPSAQLPAPDLSNTPEAKDPSAYYASVFQKPMSAPQVAGGMLDNMLPTLSSIPASVAESAARLTGFSPANQQKAHDALQLHPMTQAGRDVATAADAAVLPKVNTILQGGARALDATGIPGLSGDVGRILQTGGDVLNVFGAAAPLAIMGKEAAAASTRQSRSHRPQASRCAPPTWRPPAPSLLPWRAQARRSAAARP